MIKRLTFEDIKKRFIDQGRTDIEICEDDFQGWKKKSKFFDKVQGEYFWSIPYRVWKEEIVHPKRVAKKREETLLKRYGVKHQSQLKEVKDKISKSHLENFADPEKAEEIIKKRREGCIKKYGVDNASKAEEVREKVVKTNLKRYGAPVPAQSKDVQEKIKKTNIEKYGVNNVMKSPEIQARLKKTVNQKYGVECIGASEVVREKIQHSFQKKYGVNHPSNLQEIRDKISKSHLANFADPQKAKAIKEKRKKTCNKRYGAKSPLEAKVVKTKIKKTLVSRYGSVNPSENLIKYRVKETNESVVSWLGRQTEPKPSKLTLQRYCQSYKDQTYFQEADLFDIVHSWKEQQTMLEIACEKLFKTAHFNEKPKQIGKYYRPDFKLSSQIFLNVDGLYWHSDQQKNKRYHFNLRKEFEEHNLRIFQFREDELRDKPLIIKSIINNSLGKTKNKVFARKCKVQIVKQAEATDFLKENHLMGYTNAKHLGLYHDNKLVCLLSYKQRKHVCKIERFCSILDTNVVGGFSKLLSHLEKNYLKPEITEIHNWVDLRYGTGKHLLDKKFVAKKETLGWKWTDFNQTYNRLKCKANMDNRNLTQQQHADELGWFKIYDAGQRLYVKTKLN